LNSSKNLSTLVEDIYEKIECLSQGENMDIPQDLIDDFGERMKQALVHWTEPKKQTKGLRMSNIGRPARQLWYESKKDSEPTPLKAPTHIKFLYGHLLEELLILFVKIAGHSVSDEQKEVTVDGIKGHIDCKIDGQVVDIKTASNFGFKKFKEGTLYQDDPFGYMYQLSGYETSEGTTEGGFLAINKETGELALYCPGDLTKPNVNGRIDSLKNKLKSDTPPEKCYQPVPEGKKGNMRLPTGCAYCGFKNECWSDANNGRGLRVFKYANGLKYFTRVTSTPNVQELIIK
jgi:hypothetical protein